MPEREDDHLTPATRLLEKRREMAEVEQALNAQKEVSVFVFLGVCVFFIILQHCTNCDSFFMIFCLEKICKYSYLKLCRLIFKMGDYSVEKNVIECQLLTFLVSRINGVFVLYLILSFFCNVFYLNKVN